MAPPNHVDVLHKAMTETWDRLNEIWSQVGYEGENFSRRQNAVVKHVTELLAEMKQEAEDKLNEQQQKLDKLMEEILQLAKDLTLQKVPEVDQARGKTLLEVERILTDIASDLRKRKAIRMEKYNFINEQVIEVSQELDEIPMKVEFEGIPADSQVAKLEQHLGYLRHEKSRRLEVYKEHKRSISELFELLEKSASSSLERLATQSNEITLKQPVSHCGIKALSQGILEQLANINEDLKDQLMTNKDQGEKYWQKINDLWSRLNVDEEMSMVFTQVHKPISTNSWENIYKPSVLKGLHKELERLEEEKRQNMSLFVKQVREELCELWLSKCFISSVELRFTETNYMGITPFTIGDFSSDIFTEELLETHEREVEFWRDFVTRNKKIIDAVTKRGHMFAQYKTLDQKSDDPSRLANRGGALLKEEKERKKLEKAIPKLELELKQYCEEFEQTGDDGNGMEKFLVYGRTIHEMIEQDWEEFHEEKRLRKEAKKNPNAATTNKTLMTTQVGNPGNRKRPHTPSSVQRGAGGVTPNKRNKTVTVTPGKTIQSPFVHPSAVSSSKRPFAAPKSGKSKIPGYFRPNTSASQAASRKALRKSLGKLRNGNGSSLVSQNSSSSSSESTNMQQSSLSQPNLKVKSLEQLNFSEVIRGPVLEVIKEKQETPKRNNNKENFAHPSTGSSGRGIKKTPTNKPGMLTRQASAGKIVLPAKLTGKEPIPHSSKDTVVSPDASYSEFTGHLMCQSTLNSSAVVPQNRAAPTTPTKSVPGMTFTPAKLPLSDNCF